MSKFLVKSRGERRRRAGVSFTRAGVVIDTAQFTQEQLEAIADDPELQGTPVEELSEEEAAAQRAAKAAAKAAARAPAKKAVAKSGKAGK